MLHRLANFFVHARHAHNHRRPNLLHGLRQLVELRAVSHLRAGIKHDVIERARGHVRERQKGDAGVGHVEVEIGSSEALVCAKVAVRERHALRLAGGARGVNERGQVFRLH